MYEHFYYLSTNDQYTVKGKGGCMDNTHPLELLAKDHVEFQLLSLKAKLMLILSKTIKEQNLTQKDAAQVLGVSQPRVSNLVNGNMTKFSIDMLLEMLGRIGYLTNISFDLNNMDNPIDMKLIK